MMIARPDIRNPAKHYHLSMTKTTKQTIQEDRRSSSIRGRLTVCSSLPIARTGSLTHQSDLQFVDSPASRLNDQPSCCSAEGPADLNRLKLAQARSSSVRAAEPLEC